MNWKNAWIAVCVTMCSGLAAWGQQPIPNGYAPGLMPNPGYLTMPMGPIPPSPYYMVPPMSPYGPPPPMAPYGPVPPMAPYGPLPPMPGARFPQAPPAPMPPGSGPFPMRVPADPRFPTPPQPPMPNFNGAGPQPGAAEPYLVQPDGPAKPRPSETKPETKPITEPLQRFVEMCTPGAEPVAVYEGCRYPIEARNDHTCGWVQASYIHWWVRRDNTPPLFTTGDINAIHPLPTGTLGNADTVVLIGGGGIDPTEMNGVQATLGFWLDQDHLQSVELSGFWLGRVSRRYGFNSDSAGNPIFGQPLNVVNNNFGVPVFTGETNFNTALPGVLAGSANVNTQLDFHGLELNCVHNIARYCGWSFDALLGARYLYLNDSLDIGQTISVLPGLGNNLVFNNVPQQPGSNFFFHDSFNVTNRFYGGTIGVRGNWVYGGLDLAATFKLSLGATSHVANINGTTTFIDPAGNVTTLIGSSLAQPSNIGRFTNTEFSAVPELNLTIGYQVLPRLRLFFGYTALEWTHVQRAGDQIDRGIDVVQSPTGTQANGTGGYLGTIGTRPVYNATSSGFWAQGINVGIEVKY
jgi:hypothetical protein